jgi:hypothetical protein
MREETVENASKRITSEGDSIPSSTTKMPRELRTEGSGGKKFFGLRKSFDMMKG